MNHSIKTVRSLKFTQLNFVFSQLGGSDRGGWCKLLMVFRDNEEGRRGTHQAFFEFTVFLTIPEGCR